MKRIVKGRCPCCRNAAPLKEICTVCHGVGETLTVHLDNGEVEFYPADLEDTVVKKFTGNAPARQNVYITTFSGIRFDLEHPTPEMVSIVDIAHHLSQCCRWAGATMSFLSVAQHSVLVSMICPSALAKWGLMHDAAEAYIGDITRPLKVLLPDVREIEKRIMYVIALKFGLTWPEPEALSEYDDQMIRYEGERFVRDASFMSRQGVRDELSRLQNDTTLHPHYATPVGPLAAEVMFAERFTQLFQRNLHHAKP